MMGNGSHASIRSVDMVDLKLTSEKDRATEKHAAYPFYQQESS
jgi:hypothetical protein